MWIVKAEIKDDYVKIEEFSNKAEARKYADKLAMQGIWDDIEVYKREDRQ